MNVMARGTKRRWLWLVPIGLVIAGLLVFFAWWQYFKTTPTYSLALLVDAVQQDDRVAFDRVFDLDRVIDNFIAQSGPGSALGLNTELVGSVRQQFQSLAPETTTEIKEGVRAEIRDRAKELSGSSRPFLLTALAMPFVADVKQTGDRAETRLRNGEVEVLLERSEGGDWKVVSLRDQALAGRVVAGIVKQLPQPKSQIEEQVRRQLRTLPETLPKIPFIDVR